MKTTIPENYPKTFNEWHDEIKFYGVDPKPKEQPIHSEIEDSEGRKRRMVDAALEMANT